MRSLPKFFALVYVVSWICWLFVAWLGGGTFAPNSSVAAIAAPIFYVGVFAPAIVALLLSIFERGRPGAAELLKQIANFPKQARWYVFAILYMAAIKLSAAVLHRLAFNAWPAFGTEPLILMAIATMISTPFQAGEEIGWRGYALPRLSARFGSARASLLLGVLWAVWHLPQFYIADADTYHQSFLVWSAQVVAMSVTFAWLYARSGGSLLLVMLLHSAINNSKDVVPSGVGNPPGVFSLHASAVSWLSLGLLWLGASYFLFRMPRER
jgi:membrane protease YdiL (CAAX protease family)